MAEDATAGWSCRKGQGNDELLAMTGTAFAKEPNTVVGSICHKAGSRYATVRRPSALFAAMMVLR